MIGSDDSAEHEENADGERTRPLQDAVRGPLKELVKEAVTEALDERETASGSEGTSDSSRSTGGRLRRTVVVLALVGLALYYLRRSDVDLSNYSPSAGESEDDEGAPGREHESGLSSDESDEETVEAETDGGEADDEEDEE